MTWILTRSGKHFDYADPQPDQIDIVDIAHGLASENRFAGQTYRPYTVAQHSLIASRIVPPALALEALLHDASEAYMKDLPRPLKGLLPDYRAVESRVDAAIRAKFELPPISSPEIKQADLVLLATERRDLLAKDDTPWELLEGIEPLQEIIVPAVPEFAIGMFLRRWQELTCGVQIIRAKWYIELVAECPSCKTAGEYSYDTLSDGIGYEVGAKVECKEVCCTNCDYWFYLATDAWCDLCDV